MNTLKVTLLGTGTSQGVPVVGCDCPVCSSENPKDNRLRVAAFFEIGEDKILIDAGPDLRQQLLRQKISNIDAVLLTHEHNDHVVGLDDLRPINFLYQKTIPIYAEKRVRRALKKSFEYIFDSEYDYPGKPKLKLKKISNKSFTINGHTVIPIRVMHGELPIFGFRIQNTAYLTDVKTISDSEKKKLEGLDYLIINALHHNRHHSHLNIEEALDLIETIKPRKAFLTHISHRMGKYLEVNPTLPKGVELAYDGLILK